MPEQKIAPKAYQVTKENIPVLLQITTIDQPTLIGNLGWILVEDWNIVPRFLMMPRRVFSRMYPETNLTELKVDS